MQRINRLLLKARKRAGGSVFAHFAILERTDDTVHMTVTLWDGKEGSARDREDWRQEYYFKTHDDAVAKWEEVKRQYGTNPKYEPVLLILYDREQVNA